MSICCASENFLITDGKNSALQWSAMMFSFHKESTVDEGINQPSLQKYHKQRVLHIQNGLRDDLL